jgi:hypothetical protein
MSGAFLRLSPTAVRNFREQVTTRFEKLAELVPGSMSVTAILQQLRRAKRSWSRIVGAAVFGAVIPEIALNVVDLFSALLASRSSPHIFQLVPPR